jgi:ribosomal protein S18 acetylase RimI-like enzyme
VAVDDGQVVGYITGCVDTKRYLRTTFWAITPKVVWSLFARGLFLKKDLWLLVKAGILTGLKSGNYRNKYIPNYPAHFHLNVSASSRGQGVGQRLVDAFCLHLKTKNIKGIHIATRSDNLSGLPFFKKVGFTEMEKRRAFLPHKGAMKSHDLIILTLQL